MQNVFPEKGMAENEIQQKFSILLTSLRLHGDRAFRIYSTVPHPASLRAIYALSKFNRNNIGTHTRVAPENLKPLASMEREVILMLGNLMGAQNSDIDGYITQGGTEGNITGLWIGRNMLRGDGIPLDRICLLKTSLTHYSIDKAADILNISKVIDIPLNSKFGMDGGGLKKKIETLSKEGFRGFIIALTLGYNITGTIDPVDEIDTVVKNAEIEFGIKTHVHLDAAIGGLVYPFVSEKPFDFRYPSIQSISLDMHKTGFVPHTAGIFLCKKDLQNWIERPAPYLPYKKDDTLSGSRPGTAAAACWSVITALGKEGFRKLITYELELKEYFIELLQKHYMKFKAFVITDKDINIVAIHFAGFENNRLPAEVEKKYGLTPTFIKDHTGAEKIFYTIVFMPHLTKNVLEEFVECLT